MRGLPVLRHFAQTRRWLVGEEEGEGTTEEGRGRGQRGSPERSLREGRCGLPERGLGRGVGEEGDI